MELIIVISLIGIIVSAAMSLLLFGMNIVKVSEEEYNLQFSTRQVLETTTDVVRKSTAIFTIPESSFREDNLDSGWEYIGLRDVEISPGVTGTEVVKYSYDADTDKHIANVLLNANADTKYEFVFSKNKDDDTLVQFSIKSYTGAKDEFGNLSSKLIITSETDASNSLQIFELAPSLMDPAVAIAFRMVDRIENKIKEVAVAGNVAMVLDISGSMDDRIGTGDERDRKINILQDKATTLIESFATEENVNISLVPFSNQANAQTFYNAKTQTSTLTDAVDDLEAGGYTNTGDGLRNAYFALDNKNKSQDKFSNYLIILVDGMTNRYSAINSGNKAYLLSDGTPYVRSSGNVGAIYYTPDGYVETIGANFKDFAKVYVIAFTDSSEDLGIELIANACGAPENQVYTAFDAESLSLAFETIQENIATDLWYLEGPQL